VHALAFFAALLIAAAMAPALVHALAAGGQVRPNWRNRELPFPFGVLIVAAAVVALAPLALLQELGGAEVLHPEVGIVAVYTLGVALLGLVDDSLGGSPRGWRGHGGAVLGGSFSTGALKAAGSLGLALYVMSGRGLSAGHYLLAAAVLVLATNVFNLLDLRPGRSVKAFVLLGAGLTLGTMEARPLWTLGVFAAPVLVAGVYDLRERAMLGDTGANAVGGLAGLWLVLSLSGTGQAIAAAVLALITIYGEFRSISALVERTPGLRSLDSWGRP
jgi:UDP-N-acetylmuramyl pentapeptide phosphotransferase/UDP-N-acetylglucosamine-1-phosphate transferase